MSKDFLYNEIQSDINKSVSRAHLDNRKRQSALAKLEKLGEAQNRRVGVYYAQRDRSLSQYDILPFSHMLKSIGTAETLDLIVLSNGGDGTAAETMLDLCRKHCTRALRIVVPLYAKSAATLLALGADTIVMGETSELGPIDAQVFIVQDNADQQVSADHFLRAQNDAIQKLASQVPEVVQAAQIQLAQLSPAFLQHCQDMMNFGKDFAAKQLRAHMFKNENAAEPALWNDRIEKIVENLTASSRHLSHGRMITAKDITQDRDLQHLRITDLAPTDPYWIALNELLLRTECVMQANQIGKIMFARKFQLLGS